MSLDKSLFFWLNGYAGSNNWLDYFFVFISDNLFYLMCVIAFFSLFLWGRPINQKIKIFGAFALSCISSLIVVFFVFHNLWPRERPFELLSGVNQLVQETGSSFPSKHATISFLLATFVILLNKKLGFLFLVFAISVSLGRVFVGVHYPSDILVGAVLGILMGFLFFRRKLFD